MFNQMITWTDIFYGIGDLCTNGIFPILRSLGHKPNILFGGIIVGLLFYWMYKIPQLNKEAEEKGTLK
ncbi:MAG: hypothetical protein KatS3mg027_0649 [Bacteroidia bacterium]|nr:MAG: hypothetical protein KatS3mg027_0649 [Bacteroidia bacterium]